MNGTSDNTPARGRTKTFLRSPLWSGAPIAAGAAFAALFLIRLLGDGAPIQKALGNGLLGAALGLFTWGLGVWVAADGKGAAETRTEKGESSPRSRRKGAAGTIVLLVVTVAVASVPQIEGMYMGEISAAKGSCGIVLKFLAVAYVLLPCHLKRKR